MISFFAAIVVVTNLGFTAAFDTELKQPVWATYDLEPSEIVKTNRAAIAFHADSRIPNSDLNGDYAGSGYDRGHLVPAADLNWDKTALRQSYQFSNICPMTPALNRGKWLDHENTVRELASSSTVHVVVVPVFDAAGSTNKIGRVAVPSWFVKIAYGSFGSKVWVEMNR